MPVRSFRIFAVTAAVSITLLVGCAKKTNVASTVPPPPPPSAPTATLAASPDTVERGQAVRLLWDTRNSNEISITGVGPVTASGTTSLFPQSSTTYVLTAKGPGGSKEATARVTVTVPPPPVTAQAGPNDEQLFSQNIKDIFFAYDKYAVPQNEQSAMEQDARFLAAHPNYKLLISGHCDERGSEEYNLGLGDNRADTVRNELERLGVSADRIRTISYGKEKTFCTEETEACWQLNRRAHFSMQR